MPAEIDIIILSYQNFGHIRNCLDSLLNSDYKRFKVYIVDNNSREDVVSRIKDKYASDPRITLIENKRNLGFAEGNNIALRQARNKYAVLLNNDTVVDPGWLDPMLKKMESDDRIAACQPKILNMRDRSMFDYSGAAGGYIDRYGYPFLRGRILDTIETDSGQYNDDADLDWCSGAAFMVRRSALKEIGLFDPVLFMYGEENDLCWRMKKCGFRMVFAHDSIVYHAGMGSTGKRPLFKLHLNYRNGMILLLKNFTLGELFTRLPVRVILDLVNFLYFLVMKTRQMPYLSILWAYIELVFLLPGIAKSRSETQRLYKKYNAAKVKYQTYDISIIRQYFLLGRKKFNQLVLK
jgi:GT2 family glycosyltransferase